MKSETKFLALLITKWGWCMTQPKICKCALLAHTRFKDSLAADLIHALLCCGGDWQAAGEMVAKRGGDFERLKKFRAWAEKLTAPAKRGLLLEWKGGAL